MNASIATSLAAKRGQALHSHIDSLWTSVSQRGVVAIERNTAIRNLACPRSFSPSRWENLNAWDCHLECQLAEAAHGKVTWWLNRAKPEVLLSREMCERGRGLDLVLCIANAQNKVCPWLSLVKSPRSNTFALRKSYHANSPVTFCKPRPLRPIDIDANYSAAAYVLLQERRRQAQGTACATAQVATLRERLLEMRSGWNSQSVASSCTCHNSRHGMTPGAAWRSRSAPPQLIPVSTERQRASSDRTTGKVSQHEPQQNLHGVPRGRTKAKTPMSSRLRLPLTGADIPTRSFTQRCCAHRE